jgi:hypothetical protein
MNINFVNLTVYFILGLLTSVLFRALAIFLFNDSLYGIGLCGAFLGTLVAERLGFGIFNEPQ